MELTIAAMIALRRWLLAVSAAGGVMAIAIFLTTLSFLITTPKVDESLAERARRVLS
jgi:uncharacterized membrane protein YkgB